MPKKGEKDKDYIQSIFPPLPGPHLCSLISKFRVEITHSLLPIFPFPAIPFLLAYLFLLFSTPTLSPQCL